MGWGDYPLKVCLPVCTFHLLTLRLIANSSVASLLCIFRHAFVNLLAPHPWFSYLCYPHVQLYIPALPLQTDHSPAMLSLTNPPSTSLCHCDSQPSDGSLPSRPSIIQSCQPSRPSKEMHAVLPFWPRDSNSVAHDTVATALFLNLVEILLISYQTVSKWASRSPKLHQHWFKAVIFYQNDTEIVSNLHQTGSKWLKMAQNVSKWCKMSQTDPKWLKIAQNSSQWQQTAPKWVPKSSK